MIKVKEDLELAVKDAFYARIEYGYDNGERILLPYKPRTASELKAFDEWFNEKEFNHKELDYFMNYPGELEEQFYASGSAQIRRTSLELDAILVTILNINKALAE